MDELYIVLAILYLGYYIYRAVKKSQASKAKGGQVAPAEPKPKGKFEVLLEELLTGEQKAPRPSFDPEPAEEEYEYEPEPRSREWENQPVSLETIPKKEYFTYETPDYSSQSHLTRHVQSVHAMTTPLTVRDAPDLDWLFEDGAFDLRKAVIYSEILQRPYL